MHLMLDLETMSNKANAAILQVGAVLFDPSTGIAPLTQPFNEHVDLASAIASGGNIDAGTVMWWLSQDQAAREALKDGQGAAKPLKDVLTAFLAWCPKTQLYVWSHGASFDVPIIEVAMGRFNLKPPWQFWNIRDTRTLFDLAGKKLSDLAPKVGVKHSAADDAAAQAHAVCAAYKILGVGANAPMRDE